MTALAPDTRTPDDDDGHGGHDTPQRPETDVWRPYAVAGLHYGPTHLHHAGHRDREMYR